LAEATTAVKELIGHIEASTLEDESEARSVLLANQAINKLLKKFPEILEISSLIEEDLEHIHPWIKDAKKVIEK